MGEEALESGWDAGTRGQACRQESRPEREPQS